MNLKTVNLLFFCFLIFFGCNNLKIKNTYETDFQRNLNVFFKDATTSPLKANDLKKFNKETEQKSVNVEKRNKQIQQTARRKRKFVNSEGLVN